MENYTLSVTDEIEPAFEQVIAGGLNRFNDEMTGYNDRQPLAVIVRDAVTEAPLGGILGRSSLGLLFLELFYLPPALRGNCLGSTLLATFEQQGRERGCRCAVLYTINFQAPAFYARYGWRAFGEIPCAPPGTSRIFMSKEL
ncbi:GNAT family N-acetyltransferase [Candidatus Sodalis endolongispinus]|uniref:GNAT family N-acetyltransferase n=1 Tax=Candidatus Sodalis endolongispinus TaxID=2812662 RepID=A0ABS5Y831_9GAMM|nr:GNAT family N-acetyltransferase [Candidatus Sodalis endolongispinus]MBT9431138.1 GNAT family N-acetyltransferase [Candidatus Sodalis endolongispinus]